MTFKDLRKRIKPEDEDKVIIYSDGIGWTNVDMRVEESVIVLTHASNSPFSNDN
jgi:hypothetical protein